MTKKISACIITFNEEQHIRRCLDSVRWCDEIVVVDSFSTDRTEEICREFTDAFYRQEWLGYVGQRNFIRKKAKNEWVLFLDADEEISPQLRDQIQKELSDGDPTVVGYQFPRQVYYLGKWIRHGEWYPDIKLRLFLKAKGRSVGREPHDHVVVAGPVKTLHKPIYHYTYDNITDHLNTLNRYSSITADEKWSEGERFRLLDMLFRPAWRFFRGYVLKGGFLDGRHGVLIAGVNAFGVLTKYAKLWEKELEASARERTARGDTGAGSVR